MWSDTLDAIAGRTTMKKHESSTGRMSACQPNMQELPGTPAHAASWAIERGEDPYMAAYIRLLEMMVESKKRTV